MRNHYTVIRLVRPAPYCQQEWYIRYTRGRFRSWAYGQLLKFRAEHAKKPWSFSQNSLNRLEYLGSRQPRQHFVA